MDHWTRINVKIIFIQQSTICTKIKWYQRTQNIPKYYLNNWSSAQQTASDPTMIYFSDSTVPVVDILWSAFGFCDLSSKYFRPGFLVLLGEALFQPRADKKSPFYLCPYPVNPQGMVAGCSYQSWIPGMSCDCVLSVCGILHGYNNQTPSGRTGVLRTWNGREVEKRYQ